jgi:tetratricopeptide (TPR) repeat protein
MSILTQPGDLAETPLAAILLEALNLRASGVLEVEHAGGTSRLWFRDGRPVGAQVFTGFKPLGMMLMQAGLIDIEALSRSLALMAETHRPQGELLVEMGAVSAEAVGEMLAEQQAGYFGVIAQLEKAPFVFDGARSVPEWTRTARLSPVRTIVDALERPQANALVASALQPVAATGVRLASGYPDIAAGFRWGDAERALVARAERTVSLETFLTTPPVPPERARAILSALLLLGVAKAADHNPDEETTAGVALMAEELTATFPIAAGDAPPPPAAAAAPVAAPAVAPAVAPAPPPPAGPAPAAPPARRSDPAEARARRQRLLQQAMRNMGVGPFAGRPASDDAGAAAPPAPEPTAPRAAPAAAVSPASSPEAALRDALISIAPRAKERDLFVRLGVPETCGREDAKKAFLALAKQFHPDRFASPALADLQDLVKDFFASVNEAYEVLADDKKRVEYLRRKAGSASAAADPARAEAAKIDFMKGEACLRTRDFGRARGFLESALRADPTPQYQAALAWSFVCDPNHKDRERARTLVADALKDPSCDRALFVAGILARDDGEDAAAERHFRAAVKVNPRNHEAARELRLLEARRAERRGR